MFGALTRTAPDIASELHQQLQRVPGFTAATSHYAAAVGEEEVDRQPALTRLLIGPLGHLALNPGGRVRIIVDGLDELPAPVVEELLHAIAVIREGPLGTAVRVMLTARPRLLQQLPDLSALGPPLTLEPPAPDALAGFSRAVGSTEQTAGVVAQNARSWLDAQLLTSLADAEAQPGHALASLYDQVLRSVLPPLGQLVRPLLDILTATGIGPISPLRLAGAAGSLLGGRRPRRAPRPAGRHGHPGGAIRSRH